jgi:hypothetical protein
MHDIDLMLQLQLEGKNKEARAISDKLDHQGPDGILDATGKNTQDIWLRHSFNRGWFILQEGDYQKGSQLLENGRFINVYGNPPLYTKAPIFNPDEHDIKGKSIIVSLEGGYGDEIIHARFATSYKKMGAEKVYIASSPELVSLFSRIEGVDGVILRNQAHTVNHDFWVPGFSSGWVAGHTFDDFPNEPYLKAKPDSVQVWKTVVSSEKPKVGIRWAGNPKFEHQQFRRFPPNFILNLSKYSDEMKLYSLQRDHNIVELPNNIIDLQHLLISWEDTAAAIENLDLVITSCTSVAHLAASMGKETWVIVPILPYHTWTHNSPDSTTTPYYKNVKLFRQKTPGKWDETFQEIYTALEEKFGLTHIDMPSEDREPKKLNLGSGFKKLKGYLNVDRSEFVKPDQVVNLEQTPWPWKDNEFSHIVAKDILEHLGNNEREFLNVIKEMYRVSDNQAIWEVQVPHWRCDTALDDPGHKRLLTLGFFKMLDQKRLMDEKIMRGESDSLLAFEEEVDIELVDVQFIYTDPWQQRILSGNIKQEELNHALNHLNNVALSMVVLLQVHKAPRYNKIEFIEAIEKMSSEI